MDMVYMSDALAYQCLRGAIMDRHDYQYYQQWNSSPVDNGTQVKTGVGKGDQVQQHQEGGKCKICKERQKKGGLGSYLRRKSNSCSGRIVEEEEAEEEPAS